IHKKGNIGVVSRSSTLTYEAVLEINRAGMGQSTVIGLGDDVLIGIDFIDALSAFHADKKTKAIVMIGQLGGGFEEAAAEWYRNIPSKKPVIAFIAGNAIPFGHKMGYAGDVMTNGYISVLDKKDVLSSVGITVVDSVNDIHLELAKL
ncbi:MAG: succinate--CoA ligase subunit alpha, partial [Alphaproteobacteria bacterium]|nr:succinate--CoA ligase subunit alpha [Alphaproteobacteria bacterium]